VSNSPISVRLSDDNKRKLVALQKHVEEVYEVLDLPVSPKITQNFTVNWLVQELYDRLKKDGYDL
jgi:hypothetical protein